MALALILVLALPQASLEAAPGPGNDPERVVAVYSGPGAGAPGPLIAWVEEGLGGMRGVALGPAEIAGGGLEEASVVIFPGGMASGQYTALGEAGRAAVVEFVAGGGGYVGLCAGAYMAAAPPYEWGLGLLDASIEDHDHWERGIGKVEVELSPLGQGLFGWNGGRIDYHYGNGPIFAPGGSGAIPDYRALAWYRTGIGERGADPAVMVDTPAIVAGRFGAGRVLASSGHAEWSEGIEDFFLRYMEWASGMLELDAPPVAGSLVVAGGGDLGDEVYSRCVELARERWPGIALDVVVLPQASRREGAGSETVPRWLAAGASSARVWDDLSLEGAREAMAQAEVVWFTGGSQRRLMSALQGGQALDLIRARQSAGCLVGGTSAGAAVMSATMISGEPQPGPLRFGAMEAYSGLGLWPEVIVDQHFSERGRFDRLLTAVLDQPQLLGVGISEGTAVLVHDNRLEVIGAGLVTLIDAQGAAVGAGVTAELQTARGVSVTILKAGDSLSRRAVRRSW
ncbi:MAG: cyanophycinase [Planctomycetota bacterium]|nr:cyanophycinase [Planctomycetota bacterium]